MTHAGEATKTVLVVEDDAATRELVSITLELEGYEVVTATSVLEASTVLGTVRPELIVLDLILPGGSGLGLLDELRSSVSPAADTPVLILSGLDTPETKIRSFRMGADQYLVKPFEPKELLARVAAILRRSTKAAASSDVIDMGDLKLDLAAREVWHEGEFVETTAKGFDLIAFFASNPGRVYSRHQLLRAVWNSSSEWQGEATVTEHVRRLRAKLGERWIQTARGVGYRFERRRSRVDLTEPATVERRRDTSAV